MKKLSTAAVAAVTAGAVLLGSTGATAAPVHTATAAPAVTVSAPTYAATQAFGVAARDIERADAANPAAVPAVVGTAFVAGAAYGAGKVVAGWAAKKVIGRWDVVQVLDPAMLD